MRAVSATQFKLSRVKYDGTAQVNPVATATVSGLVPTPPNNTTTFLRGDATFAAPAGASQLVLISTVTASGSSTTVDFLNSFSSTYDSYIFTGKNIACSSAYYLIVRVAASGTPITTSTYNNTFITNAATTVNVSTTSLGWGDSSLTRPANYGVSAQWEFMGANNTNGNMCYRGISSGSAGVANGGRSLMWGGEETSGIKSGVQITNGGQAGTFTGTFQLFGIKNT